MQNRIAIEHMQVLKTLKDSGSLNKHQVKSIRGQIIKMKHSEREEYLNRHRQLTWERLDRRF